jgi:Uma2 family endonuclease
MTQTPDWLCEVQSPSTAKLDRTKKLGVYARERVSCVWLAMPLEKTIEVYMLHGSELRLETKYSGRERVRIAPFEAIELDLDWLWPAALDLPKGQRP